MPEERVMRLFRHPARTGAYRRCVRALATLIALLVTAPALAGDYRVLEDLRYTPPDWPAPLAGDLYLPEHSGPRPVVLVVHGGSWKSGDRASFDATRIARPLAARGFAVFSVDYRLAPAARFPAPLADLQQAIAWLRANAATYRLDPDAVGAWGYSAGAHLVAMLGTTAGASLRLRAVVTGGLPADLTAWPDSGAVRTFLGKSAREDRELSAAASPINHITAATPPFFLYHGAIDTLVEPEQTQRFATALAARGVTVDTLYLRHFGHVLTAVFPGKALEHGAAFLDRHLAVPSPLALPENFTRPIQASDQIPISFPE